MDEKQEEGLLLVVGECEGANAGVAGGEGVEQRQVERSPHLDRGKGVRGKKGMGEGKSGSYFEEKKKRRDGGG